MRLLKRIWDDIKKGENIDLYVTVVVAFGLVLLDLIGFAPQNWLSSIILAVLGLIAISTLGNRYRLEELSHKLTQSNELFLDEFPARLKDDFEAGTEVWLVGVTLARTVKTYYVAMERKIRKGHIIKVLLVHPEGPPIEMAETRIYGRMDVQRTIGDIRNTLQDLCDLRAIAPDRLQIRTIKNPLAYGAIAINPDSPLGVLYLEHYPYKVPGGSRPKLVLRATDGQWYEFFREEIRILWENGIDWQCPESK
jgi:hypothetical protein